MTGPVFRFAPSPNGRLHLGHALSALTNERFARAFGGRLLLRIEDIDRERCRPEFEDAIHADLAWLGIAFDGAVRRQSEHFSGYRAGLGRLPPGTTYPCFCSRGEIAGAVAAREAATGAATTGGVWPRDPDGAPLYPGTCRRLPAEAVTSRLAAGAAHTLRLAMDTALERIGTPVHYTVFAEDGAMAARGVDARRWGDVVLARREVPTSYHLAVVLDDAAQGVTHVVRGRDLEAATEVHVVLQRLLGLPTPLHHFHPLLLDEDGEKLAKRRFSRSLADLRAEGVTPAAIRERLGFG